MATLVLSTGGQALGGPVGGAIGALIGQSIDQQLLGGSRGPRLGDLSVQTSSYGTQVPRVYGTMRVAGSIVWATDLVEGSSTSGVKGQPDAPSSREMLRAASMDRRAAGISRSSRLLRDRYEQRPDLAAWNCTMCAARCKRKRAAAASGLMAKPPAAGLCTPDPAAYSCGFRRMRRLI